MYSFILPAKKRQKVAKTFDPAKSKTQQEFVKECDINHIVAKHTKEKIPFPTGGRYGDVSNAPDFREALDLVNDAQEQFLSLDASVRRYYGDSVEKFLTALNDPNEQKNLNHFGIFKKEPPGSPAAPPPAGNNHTEEPKLEPKAPKKAPEKE